MKRAGPNRSISSSILGIGHTFLKEKQHFLLLTILFHLKKYITFLFYLMHDKYGKQKFKCACLTREPMIIVFHTSSTHFYFSCDFLRNEKKVVSIEPLAV